MYNAITSLVFSDQPISGSGSNNSVYSIDTVDVGYNVENAAFENATILLVFRDGVQWTVIDAAYTSGLKQCKLVGDIIEFNTTLAPLQLGENVTVLFIASGGDVVVSEPITLNEAKGYMRMTGSGEDTLISEIITAARLSCERYVNMSFVPRTITASITNSLGGIALPYGPVIAVIYVKDEDDVDVEYKYTRGYLREPLQDFLEVNYTAGYSILPKDFKVAILRQIAYLWRNRGDMNISNDLSASAMEILYKYRSII